MHFYIMGPYTALHPRQVLKNVNTAIDIGIELMKLGHSVYVLHFTHYMHLRPNCPFEYEEYMQNDLEWLEISDAVFFIDHSPGTDRELKYAKELNKKVFYNLSKVPKK